MAYPPISTLPSPPSRQDPANFAAEADAFLGALPTFQSQVNAAGTYIDGIGAAVDADAATASAAAAAALATANVTLWVSGTNYTQGAAVYSPITFFTYRRKITGAGTTDPSLDSTNWALVVGTGDVTLDGVQTLTNKTLTSPVVNTPTVSGAILNDGYTEEVFAVTGTTPALSPTNGSIQTWTLSGSSTPTAGTWNSGQSITLMIDDGSAATVTWTSLAVTWKTDGGVAPTLNTTGFTVVVLWKVGTTLYGARVGDA
jgi:hypothetical protein